MPSYTCGNPKSILNLLTGQIDVNSPEVLKHLNELNRKRAAERTGTVTIEELGQVNDETGAVGEHPQGE